MPLRPASRRPEKTGQGQMKHTRDTPDQNHGAVGGKLRCEDIDGPLSARVAVLQLPERCRQNGAKRVDSWGSMWPGWPSFVSVCACIVSEDPFRTVSAIRLTNNRRMKTASWSVFASDAGGVTVGFPGIL